MKIVLEKILADQHSSDVIELIEQLPADNEAAVEAFCNRFDYLADNPKWLHESLLQIDLHDVLGDIVREKLMNEEIANQDLDLLLADLRMS